MKRHLYGIILSSSIQLYDVVFNALKKKKLHEIVLIFGPCLMEKRKRRRFQSAFLINHSFLGMEIISTSFHKSLEYMFVFLSFLKDREVECWNINARVNRKFVHRMKDSVERPNSNLDRFKTSGWFKNDYLGLDNCASNWSDRTSELYSTYSIVHFLGFFLAQTLDFNNKSFQQTRFGCKWPK